VDTHSRRRHNLTSQCVQPSPPPLTSHPNKIGSILRPGHTHTAVQCESKNPRPPPCGFLTFFPERLGIISKFLHSYYTFISTLDCKFLFNYLQFWQSYAILSETTHQIFDISLELNLYVCLLSKWCHCGRHVISNMFVDIIKAADLGGWLATITINKAINDFRKRLNACVSADGGHFEHIT